MSQKNTCPKIGVTEFEIFIITMPSYDTLRFRI
jgi:hypothetical protein